MKKTIKKNIRTPEEALGYAMSTLKGPYKPGSKELEIMAKDPRICLFYIKYVVLPEHAIPDTVLKSIIQDEDIFAIFKSMFKEAQITYKKIQQIFQSTSKLPRK